MSQGITINIKSAEEIKILREGGKILYEILHTVAEEVCPGVSTGELNEEVENLLAKHGAEGAFKGYHGYPAALCTSVNEACVHGIPDFDYILEEGDIIGLDMGVRYKGLVTDSAITVPVGEIDPEELHLMRTTQKALYEAIKVAVEGNRVGMISSTIQKIVEKQGYNPVRDLVGHGVGYDVHEPPEVPNFGNENDGPLLKEGMVIAIEPIIAMGDYKVRALKDKWTMVTVDGSVCAHFEHTVAVGKKEALIITAE